MSPLSPHDVLQLARFSLDHAEDATFWTDEAGQMLYANAAARRALGHSGEELLKLRLFDLAPELTPELWAQLWKEIRSREQFAFEFSLQARDKHIVPVEITVHRMPLGNREYLCAFFRDVNERKHLQQLKNEFVSTVSHELRTPMTIIRESVSQVVDGLCGEIGPAQKEALGLSLAGIDRLARIINDLLDISKMEAGKATLRWDRVNLDQLVREVVEGFLSRARERGIGLVSALPDHPVMVYADYDRIVQVLTNLIGNALKFSERGSIVVEVREDATHVRCSVTDTGIGIAPEDLERVFTKFEQLSQPAVTGEKGSGLGLSICKGIIELHQGHIAVESEPGVGSTFRFSLPKRTGRDLFQQKLAMEIGLARANKANVSAIRFVAPSETVNEVADKVRGHGVRRTDILIKDADGVWVILLNMSHKEARRVVDNVLESFETGVLSAAVSAFPEDGTDDRELMSRLEHPRAA